MTKRHDFKAAPPFHDLKAADLIISKPELGKEPSNNLSAASLTSGAPEFTAPALAQTLLKEARKEDIWVEIDAALKAAVVAKGKPPSPRQLRHIVPPQLTARGLKALKGRIEKVGHDFKEKYPSRFQPRGKRWK
jgi:hypothetical protein